MPIFKFRTAFMRMLRAELLSSPALSSSSANLLLDLCLLGLRRPSIALAETFTTSAIATLDEAGG